MEQTFREFTSALTQEIQALKQKGGAKIHLTNGRFLSEQEGWFRYSFTMATELRLPSDIPIELEVGDRKAQGMLLHAEGQDLVILIEEDFGESVPNALLHTNTWFLLEALRDRLASARLSHHLLAEQLLRKESPPRIDALVQGETNTQPAELNTHQWQAIQTILSQPVTFIWGPPGTGKTKTLGSAVHQLLDAGESILVVAHSNIAVDVALLSAMEYLKEHPTYLAGKVLRYGVYYDERVKRFPKLNIRGILRERNPNLVNRLEHLEAERRLLIRRLRKVNLTRSDKEALSEHLQDIVAEIRSLNDQLKAEEKRLLKGAQVVGCTLSKAAIDEGIFGRTFDAVLVDEASMAYIPHCVFMACLASKRIAVFGDFRQLPPIATAKHPLVDKWLRRDIFEEAGIVDLVNKGQEDPRLVLLARQYRMHPEISAVVNQLFYGGRLEDAPQVVKNTRKIVNRPPLSGNALALLDIDACDASCVSDKETHSRFNVASALITCTIADASQQAGSSTGIITPYKSQARLIRQLFNELGLRGISVSTVHRFQGSEQDVIVFDIVDAFSKKPGRPLQGDFHSPAMRLANVAISRAKGKFVAVVDQHYLEARMPEDSIFRELMTEIAARKTLPVTWEDFVGYWAKRQWGIQALTREEARTEIEENIRKAREEIALHWRGMITVEHFQTSLLKQAAKERKVRIFLSGTGQKGLAEALPNTVLVARRLPFNVVCIDRRMMWFWLFPKDNEREPVILRIPLPTTAKLLHALLQITNREEPALLESRLSEKQGIYGICPQCESPLHHHVGRYGPYLKCTNPHCRFTKGFTKEDATTLAQLLGVTCPRCNGPMVGRKGSTVFLGCSNYPRCRGRRQIRDVLL